MKFFTIINNLPNYLSSLQEKKSNLNKNPGKLLVAKWISEGGMSAYKQILKMIFVIVVFICIIILLSYLIKHITHTPSRDVKTVADNVVEVFEKFLPKKYSEIQLSTNDIEEVYQTNLNFPTMFYVVIASLTLYNRQFITVQAFIALLQNPTEVISRKFGIEFFHNLCMSPLMIVTLMKIFVCGKEIMLLYLHIIVICWIPLSFFLNLILWIFTSIALYYKDEIADQESTKVERGLLQIDPAHRRKFSQTFFEKSKQTSKQQHTTRKRTSQNSGCQKKTFKIVWEKFHHRAGSI